MLIQLIICIIHISIQISCDRHDFNVNTASNLLSAVSNNNSGLEVNKHVNISSNKIYFCGVPNAHANSSRHKRYVMQGSKWKKMELTWAITVTSGRESVRSIAEYEFQKATELWSDSSKLIFRRVSPQSNDIDIIIHFVTGAHGDPYSFDGPGSTLAHAFYPDTSLSGDVHFDDSENFISHSESKKGTNGIDLFIVAAHELGHSLGLYHSNDANALMAPIYQKFEDDKKLPYDDEIAIQILYGKKDTVRTGPRWPSIDVPQTTTRRTTTRRQPPPTTTTRSTTRRRTTPFYPRWTTPRLDSTTRYRWTTPRTYPTTPWWTTKYVTHTTTSTSTTQRYIPPRTSPPSSEVCDLKPPKDKSSIDICNGTFDAVLHMSETFFFSGEYVWRIRYDRKQVTQVKILALFHEFRKINIRTIDAACVCHGSLVLFSGKNVIKMKDGKIEFSTLDNIKVKGVEKIDAAWTWAHNGYTYLLSGQQYWRLDRQGYAEPDYPRDSSVWQGLPKSINAAATIDGQTYFFSGNVFWTFNDLEMKATDKPMLSAPFWLGCPHPEVVHGITC